MDDDQTISVFAEGPAEDSNSRPAPRFGTLAGAAVPLDSVLFAMSDEEADDFVAGEW